MKKKLYTLLTALLFVCVLTLGLTVSANGGYVLDESGLLSAVEKEQINRAAERVSLQYDCGVYIVTVDDYKDYGYDAIEDFSEAFYKANPIGFGDDGNALLLVLSMEERDYTLTAHGQTANAAFTDYGKGVLAEEFLDDFSRDDWGGGLSDYVSTAGRFLDRAAAGNPVDVAGAQQTQRSSSGIKGLFSAIPAALIAWFTCGRLKSGMKTARIAAQAGQYVAPDGVGIDRAEDRYSHTTTVRQPIARNGGGSGGPGGTSVNAGGFSHGSGKF